MQTKEEKRYEAVEYFMDEGWDQDTAEDLADVMLKEDNDKSKNRPSRVR